MRRAREERHKGVVSIMRSVRGDEAYISDKPRREETEHKDDGIQGLEDHNDILARA